MDVAAWLKNLGLGQYEAAFRDNAIEGDLLPTLTAEDPRDLGVTIVGHRRKLLDAIAALRAPSKPTPPPAPADPPATLHAPAVASRPQSRSGADAERRPIGRPYKDGNPILDAMSRQHEPRLLLNVRSLNCRWVFDPNGRLSADPHRPGTFHERRRHKDKNEIHRVCVWAGAFLPASSASVRSSSPGFSSSLSVKELAMPMGICTPDRR